MRLLTAFLGFMLTACSAATVATRPVEGALTTVILVRHAEKAPVKDDPSLTEAGLARAQELARVLRDVRFDAVLTTPYQRTRMTAAPVAAQAGLSARETKESGAGYIQEVLGLVRGEYAGKTLLVVGHSNTTPEVISALGVPEKISIADDEYDRLFVVAIDGAGPARMVALRYGARAP